MSEAIKPTPGEWLIDGGTFVYALNEQGYNRFWAHVQPGNSAPMESTTTAEMEAVAALIAEAGNTYNTTGLTPRQLVEQARKLEEALRNLDDYVCNNLSSDYPTGVDVNGAEFKAARAALSKSLPNTVAEVK